MNRKRKGINFEREVKEKLKKQYPLVLRQASSYFPDLVAIGDRITFVECKYRRFQQKDFSRMRRLVKKISLLSKKPVEGLLVSKEKSYIIAVDNNGKLFRMEISF